MAASAGRSGRCVPDSIGGELAAVNHHIAVTHEIRTIHRGSRHGVQLGQGLRLAAVIAVYGDSAPGGLERYLNGNHRTNIRQRTTIGQHRHLIEAQLYPASCLGADCTLCIAICTCRLDGHPNFSRLRLSDLVQTVDRNALRRGGQLRIHSPLSVDRGVRRRHHRSVKRCRAVRFHEPALEGIAGTGRCIRQLELAVGLCRDSVGLLTAKLRAERTAVGVEGQCLIVGQPNAGDGHVTVQMGRQCSLALILHHGAPIDIQCPAHKGVALTVCGHRQGHGVAHLVGLRALGALHIGDGVRLLLKNRGEGLVAGSALLDLHSLRHGRLVTDLPALERVPRLGGVGQGEIRGFDGIRCGVGYGIRALHAVVGNGVFHRRPLGVVGDAAIRHTRGKRLHLGLQRHVTVPALEGIPLAGGSRRSRDVCPCRCDDRLDGRAAIGDEAHNDLAAIVRTEDGVVAQLELRVCVAGRALDCHLHQIRTRRGGQLDLAVVGVGHATAVDGDIPLRQRERHRRGIDVCIACLADRLQREPRFLHGQAGDGQRNAAVDLALELVGIIGSLDGLPANGVLAWLGALHAVVPGLAVQAVLDGDAGVFASHLNAVRLTIIGHAHICGSSVDFATIFGNVELARPAHRSTVDTPTGIYILQKAVVVCLLTLCSRNVENISPRHGGLFQHLRADGHKVMLPLKRIPDNDLLQLGTLAEEVAPYLSQRSRYHDLGQIGVVVNGHVRSRGHAIGDHKGGVLLVSRIEQQLGHICVVQHAVLRSEVGVCRRDVNSRENRSLKPATAQLGHILAQRQCGQLGAAECRVRDLLAGIQDLIIAGFSAGEQLQYLAAV